jgi:hypothetical protein
MGDATGPLAHAVLRETVMRAHIAALVLGSFVAASAVHGQQPGAGGQAPAELTSLAQELRQARRAFTEAGDFSARAIEGQKTQLAGFRARLLKLPHARWPIADQVDWYVLQSEVNQLDFDQRIRRPTSRDPGFYVQQAVAGMPVDGDALPAERAAAVAARLKMVPALLEQARRNLTEASPTHAQFALRAIDTVRGVRIQRSAVGDFQSLARAAGGAYPEVAAAADAAAKAMTQYAAWIRTSLPKMTAPGHIGADNFNWYLRNVLMMPYTADQLLVLGERDLTRSVANLAYAENQNRNLPPLLPAATPEEYQRRVEETDRLVRRWLKEGNILTVPDDTPPTSATVPWKEGGKAGQVTPTHYWQDIQFRDPAPDHLHAGIPGHKYDGTMMRRNPRPVRAGHSDRGRSEGWAFYLEEMALRSGLLDNRPRSRELIENFQLFRYVRMILDVKMSAGEMTPERAVAFEKEWVPMMEDQVAWSEASGYYTSPGGGTVYTAGKYQIEEMIARLRKQRGTQFDLRAFHDAFMAAGSIPMVLIEWELSGDDTQLKRVVGPSAGAAKPQNSTIR